MLDQTVKCLMDGCEAPATADEPTAHEGTSGPVLMWQVSCAEGHHYTDYTTLDLLP